MVIRVLGREFYLPLWFKITFISIIVVCLIVFGVIITKTRSSGEISSLAPSPSPGEASPLSSPTAVPYATAEVHESTPYDVIYVYVVGEIKKPDVYEIADGAILKDLVEMAGGLTEKADREAINLASRLSGGMMIKIPAIGACDKSWIVDAGIASSSEVTTDSLTKGAKVNINTASAAELCALPGIGQSTALKIISYRTENGKFAEITDIMKVAGIKNAKYSEIKDYITV